VTIENLQEYIDLLIANTFDRSVRL
jgi:E3 ubiquitin-protein ligase TRIP12